MALKHNQNNEQKNKSTAQNNSQTINSKNNKDKKTKTEKALTFLTWGAIFVLWYVITRLGIFTPTLLPGPVRVWKAFLNILENGYNGVPLWIHLGASFKRLFVALFFAIFSVTVFIFYHLYIDLYKRRVYLGSLKAFGLTKKRLEKYYTGQMLKFLGKITFLALVGAIIAGYSGMIREVWSLITNVETEALYFQLIDMNNMINIKNLYLLLFILFLFLGGYISVRFACKKILSISPGDLVKDRVE